MRFDTLLVDASGNSLCLDADSGRLERALCADWLLRRPDGRVQDRTVCLLESSRGSGASQYIVNQGVAIRLHGDATVASGNGLELGISNSQPCSGGCCFVRTWIPRVGDCSRLASHPSRVAAQG
jgi:hypothetical protein